MIPMGEMGSLHQQRTGYRSEESKESALGIIKQMIKTKERIEATASVTGLQSFSFF